MLTIDKVTETHNFKIRQAGKRVEMYNTLRNMISAVCVRDDLSYEMKQGILKELDRWILNQQSLSNHHKRINTQKEKKRQLKAHLKTLKNAQKRNEKNIKRIQEELKNA